jgi:hypothetical protein
VWLVYSAISSGRPAAEVYFARGCFTLLAVLVLLQPRVPLPGVRFTQLAVLVLLQRRVTLLGVGLLFYQFWSSSSGGLLCWVFVYSASSSGPPAAEGYFAEVCRFSLLAVLVLLQRRVALPRWVGLLC